MLVAVVAAGFVGCKKTASESETHSQTFALGETSYSIDNAITIENIQYQGSDVYNAIVVYTGKLIGQSGGEGKGVTILFKGDITTGTHNLSGNNNAFPKYIFADLSVTDITNFDIAQLLDDDDAYIATSGSFTLGISDGTYTITTSGIEVENAADPNNTDTSSVDYEGSVLRYVLATVVEGNLNGDDIVTAGRTKYNLLFIETQIVSFITINGDMIGFTSTTPFTDGLPEGEFTNDDYPIIMLEEMNINSPRFASSGNIVISKSGDNYTIDFTDIEFSGVEGIFTMHYVGTMPYFDFPF
jgi:hypothetical protein